LSLRSPNEHTIQPPKIAVQPPFSTIPCKILYFLANPVLPFLMFSSPSTPSANRSPAPHSTHSNRCHPEHSEGSAFLFLLASCHSPLATAPLSPFRATLTDHSQLTKNPAALSPFAATLTRRVEHKSIVCHSYRKHPGSHPSSQNPAVLPAPNRKSPATALVLSLPPVTGHQSQVTKSFIIRTSEKHTCNPFRIRTSKTQHLKPFRIRTYKKTGGGAYRQLTIR